MNRTLSIDRLYSLGDYKNIHVSDTISDLPEEVAVDQNAVDMIRLLQLVSVDLVHQRYVQLNRKLSEFKDGSEERYNTLLEIRANVMDDLIKILNKE